MAMDMSVALKITAGVQGEQAVERLNTKLRDLGQQGDRSAKQIRQAYQQLPAQLQDVVVSLAGGQNPFMVLLQQGSQVSTQFGGIGNSIRALTALITPARVALTGLAGAFAAVGAAAMKGYQESINLQRQIALTGNYAGVTADSFERAAARIQRAAGSTAAASREMLIGSIGSGAFGPGAIEDVASAMTRLQRLSGQSTEDVVKMFSGMSKGVADWSANANRAYNFLSIEQYKHIKLLEEQGRQEEAMRVAANALNTALSDRKLELGLLERGWNSVKNTASEAWNAMLNIGRQGDPIADEIASLQKRIEASQRLRDNMRLRKQPVPAESDEERAIKAQLSALQEQLRLRQRAADQTARNAQATQKAIEAEKKAEDERKRAAAQALSDEKARESILRGLQEEITKLARGEDALTIARLRSLGASDEQIKSAMSYMRTIQVLSEHERTLKDSESARKQILERLNDEVNKLTVSEEDLTVQKLKAAHATKEEIDQAVSAIRVIEARKNAREAENEAKKKSTELTREANQVRQSVLTEEERLQEEITKLKALHDQKYLDWVTYYRAVEKARADFMSKLTSEGEAVTKSVRTPEEKLGDDIQRLKELLDAGVISLTTYSRAVSKARDEFTELANKGSMIGELKKAIEGFGKSAADAFVEFAFAANKATESIQDRFKKLVSSILQDIARMLIYKSVTQPLFSAISGMIPFANGGVMTDQGSMPLKRYARGGIANSPQLALFGEGRMPEAYVPLPDGRSIPVTMDGAGGQTSVVVNVNMASGQTEVQNERGAGDLGRLIAGAVKAELINQKRPGGLLAAA